MVVGFTILIWLSAKTHQDASPSPQRVVGTSGETVFAREDILAGQSVFLKYGLMDNRTIWCHGAYLGPDFSAAYLHALTVDANEMIAKQKYGRSLAELCAAAQSAVSAQSQQLLKQNKYAVEEQSRGFTDAEGFSYRRQIQKWTA
jgi:nitric oxide reductase subunit B